MSGCRGQRGSEVCGAGKPATNRREATGEGKMKTKWTGSRKRKNIYLIKDLK